MRPRHVHASRMRRVHCADPHPRDSGFAKWSAERTLRVRSLALAALIRRRVRSLALAALIRRRVRSLALAALIRRRVRSLALAALIAVGAAPPAVWAAGAAAQQGVRPCGPKSLYVEPDAEGLLVLCEQGDRIVRLDPRTGRISADAATGEGPFDLCPHPDGRRLFVSCRFGQQIAELDARSLKTLRRWPLRGDPTGVAVSADGRRLYAGVHSLDQVAVFDIETGLTIKRLAAGNGPEMVRLSVRQDRGSASRPGAGARAEDAGRVYVTNLLSNPVPPFSPCQNEITVIDDGSARVAERIMLENANVGRGVDFTSDGSLAVVAVSRPKNLIPMVQVARGWVVTNGFAVVSSAAAFPPLQLLVDLPNQSYADPYGVAVAPDDQRFYLTCAGADTVIAVDLAAVLAVAEEIKGGTIPRPADHLGLSRRYVRARIPVGANPEAIAISRDGRWVYVANRLDDSISVIDAATNEVARTWPVTLSPPRGKSEASSLAGGDSTRKAPDRGLVTRLRRGERFFHSAARTFQRQFSCSSCHPDSGFDGLQYDLEPDGLGENILDNRNLRGVGGTGPFKWIGSNPDITTQCGTRTAKWIVRTGWLSSAEVVALAGYIRRIRPVVNPYRPADGKLTAAQRRGKALFERTATNDGEPIPLHNRCTYCHAGPKFSDGRQSDVGTKAPRDRTSKFDSAHLVNIFESAPYLHDGRAATLEEIWTRYNPQDKHGVSSDWTKRQLNDLVEYLKSL